jgi:small subunit ribosomal protein S1
MLALSDNNALLDKLQVGDIRDGKIVSIVKASICVDIEGFAGFVTDKELGHPPTRNLMQRYRLGDTISVKILSIDRETNQILLSHEQAIWNNNALLDKLQVGDIRDGKILDIVKASIFVDIQGLTGIVQPQELGHPSTKNLMQKYRQGDTISVKILSIDREKRRIFLSHKQVKQEEHKSDLMNSLNVGDIRDGFINTIKDFGIFVDIGGADGLVHTSELSWGRFSPENMKQMFSPGDPIRVVVINIDTTRKRIGLSRKRLLTDPWEGVETRYKVGDWYVLPVSNVTPFGVFLKFEEGVEGLLHKSELPEGMDETFQRVFQVGQQVNVRVISIDTKKRRIGLRMRPEQ